MQKHVVQEESLAFQKFAACPQSLVAMATPPLQPCQSHFPPAVLSFCHVLPPKTEIEWSTALCVTACSAVVSFLIILLLLFLSPLPKLLAGPWLNSALGSAAAPLGLAEPSRVWHSLPFGAGIETFNTGKTLQSLPVYLKKSLLCSPTEVPSSPCSSERPTMGFCTGGLLFC